MKPSLLVIMERARAFLKGAVNRVIKETALPAYLLEGILLDILAEVREQKSAEILAQLERSLAAQPEPPALDNEQESPIAEKIKEMLKNTAPDNSESEE